MLDVFLPDGAAEKQKQGEGWKTDTEQLTTYIAQKGQQQEPLSFRGLISRGLNSSGPIGWEQREPKPYVFAVQLHGSV